MVKSDVPYEVDFDKYLDPYPWRVIQKFSGAILITAKCFEKPAADRIALALNMHDRLVEALAALTAACEEVAEDLDERDVVMWAQVSGNAAAAFALLAEIEREVKP